MSDVRIEIDSREFEGWKRVAVSRTVESLCGTFELELSDKLQAGTGWDLVPNRAVTVYVGGQQVMSGLIDRLSVSKTTDRTGMTISGRDKTADLVDASALNEPGNWTETNLDELARALCGPFNIKVVNRLDELFDFPFTLQTGESPWEAINRANEFQGALIYTDRLGRLVLSEAGKNLVRTEDRLETGRNVVEARLNVDYSQRFSRYIVKGQKTSKQNAGLGWGSTTKRVNFEATATDEVIQENRFRPKLFQAEGTATQKQAQRRADLEASVRAAKSTELTVKTRGWLTRDSELWPVNSLIYVNIPTMGLDERRMMIASVTFRKSLDAGTQTELKLRREDAYQKLLKKTVRKGTVNTYGW